MTHERGALAGTGRWISFWLLPRRPPRVTDTWDVADRLTGRTSLGEVRWVAQWRRYLFVPAAGRVFDATCLRDISDFCDRVMQDRQRRRKQEA